MLFKMDKRIIILLLIGCSFAMARHRRQHRLKRPKGSLPSILEPGFFPSAADDTHFQPPSEADDTHLQPPSEDDESVRNTRSIPKSEFNDLYQAVHHPVYYYERQTLPPTFKSEKKLLEEMIHELPTQDVAALRQGVDTANVNLENQKSANGMMDPKPRQKRFFGLAFNAVKSLKKMVKNHYKKKARKEFEREMAANPQPAMIPEEEPQGDSEEEAA